MSKVEMLSMLRFGADRIFANEEGEAPTDQELAAIIDRSIMLGQSGVAVTASHDVPLILEILPNTASRPIKMSLGASLPSACLSLTGRDVSEFYSVVAADSLSFQSTP